MQTQKRINSMSSQMSLKLIIDPKSGRVLFAEAGKDVVDFIFSILYMPLASVVKLLTKENMVGSIGSIYKSVESMAETHLECYQAKSLILSPTFASPSKFLTASISLTRTNSKYYQCGRSSNCSSYVTDIYNTLCPSCRLCNMTTELIFASPVNASGFVKGPVACTIMDDLTVTPVSSVATLALLNKLNIKDASLLEERTVKFGTKEGLELLKASLKSKTVLTDVFIRVKAEPK